MMTIHEIATIAGVSVRTLRYYDKIGLLSGGAHKGGVQAVRRYDAGEAAADLALSGA